MAKTLAFVNGQIIEVEQVSKAQAAEITRMPLVREALTKLVGKGENSAELVDWLFNSREKIQDSYDTGTIKRVSKQERKSLEKALEYIATTLKGDAKAEFVITNKEEILETFKWPNQTRIKPEDKAEAIKVAFLELTEDNAELTDWLMSNKDELDIAYATGVVKREVSQKTLDALAAHQAARKAAKEAVAVAA